MFCLIMNLERYYEYNSAAGVSLGFCNSLAEDRIQICVFEYYVDPVYRNTYSQDRFSVFDKQFLQGDQP